MKKTGIRILEDSSSWSAVGIFDALKKIPRVYKGYLKVKNYLKKNRPDGAVLIDTPAFNLPLARFIHSLNIPCLYFFPPSAWKEDLKRAASVGRSVRKVIAPFEETARMYEKAGVPTYFSGHPMLDLVHPRGSMGKIFSKFHLDSSRPVIGLLPGSREQEIRYLLSLELEAARILLKKIPSLQFVLPIAAGNLENAIVSRVKRSGLPILARRDASREVMLISDLLLVASGTATLEAALHEKPMVIVYKVSPWSWRLEKPFLKGVRFAGLPNLLAGREIVPELIQEKATVENIVKKLHELLTNANRRKEMISNLQAIRTQLGSPGATERVAKLVLETFSG